MKSAEAYALLNDVYALFDEGFATTGMQEARQCLKQLVADFQFPNDQGSQALKRTALRSHFRLCQRDQVIPATQLIALANSTLSDYTQARHTRRERVSSAMDGKLRSIHGAWIPAIHAGMTSLEDGEHVI